MKSSKKEVKIAYKMGKDKKTRIKHLCFKIISVLIVIFSLAYSLWLYYPNGKEKIIKNKEDVYNDVLKNICVIKDENKVRFCGITEKIDSDNNVTNTTYHWKNDWGFFDTFSDCGEIVFFSREINYEVNKYYSGEHYTFSFVPSEDYNYAGYKQYIVLDYEGTNTNDEKFEYNKILKSCIDEFSQEAYEAVLEHNNEIIYAYVNWIILSIIFTLVFSAIMIVVNTIFLDIFFD